MNMKTSGNKKNLRQNNEPTDIYTGTSFFNQRNANKLQSFFFCQSTTSILRLKAFKYEYVTSWLNSKIVGIALIKLTQPK
jgi:hypothetical protein